MLNFYAKDDCGCCVTKMLFESERSAYAAFRKAGLGDSVTVTDDAGTDHEDIDTYFGYTLDQKEMAERNREYLLNAVVSGSAMRL